MVEQPAVVNDQLAAVRPFPAKSLIPLVTAAVWDVKKPSDDDGLNTAVCESGNEKVPVMLVPRLFLSVKVVLVTVDVCIGSLNLAVIDVVTAILVAPLVGMVLTSVGGVVSDGGAAAVVNDQLAAVRPFPAKSLIPLVTAACVGCKET